MIGAFHQNVDAQNSNNEQYVTANYFCGSGLGRDQTDGTPNNNVADGTDDGTGIRSDDVPFILRFRSDKNPGNVVTDNNNNNPATSAQNELGFSLDYRISTSCPDLTTVNPTTG